MKKGFSIIELLVVIAVIAILGSFLFPAFTRAREKGREAACANNLHQLHVAFIDFATEHDNRLPWARSFYAKHVDQLWHLYHGWVSGLKADGSPLDPVLSGSDPTPSIYYTWYGVNGRRGIAAGQIFGQIKGVYTPGFSPGNSMGIFVCPTFAVRGVCNQDDAVRGYSMNGNLNYHNMYGVSSAATNVLLGDEHMAATPVNGLAGGATAGVSKHDPWFDPGQLATNHTGMGQCVCLDGHVEKR